jgi:hypothetical protein
MMLYVRGIILGTSGLALALGLLAGGAGTAADDKALPDEVVKVASALEKQDSSSAKKMAGDIAKGNELEVIMHLFALRTKKGLGVGRQPGAVTPDGIERKIIELAKKQLPDKQLAEESPALTEMSYTTAAMALIAHAKAPAKDDGKKKVRDWLAWSEELREASLQMASAAKDKKAAELHKAATKVDGACNKCHDVFKD